MNHSKGWFGLVALGLAALATPAPGAIAADPVLIRPLWDDGRAEFSIYVGTTERYGQTRPTEARLIVVKEDLLRESLVKSDAGPIPGRTVEAIKLIMVADFQTGTYTYHQMASVFFDRATERVLKETMSHTEACGITFVRVGPKGGRLVHEAHSYWDGEADRETPLVWPEDGRERLYWDGLPVSLRRWVAGGHAPFEVKAWLLPTQVSGRAPLENARPVEALIRMSDGGTLVLPAGRFKTRKFSVTSAAGTDLLWFDEAFPHPLVRLVTAAGRKIELKRTLRLDYWNHHMNGDEAILATR
jgi:hypothetical protein